MRSIGGALVLLLALFACALAESVSSSSDTMSYDSTVYITSTIYRINTITLSGSRTASFANQTSTISATGANSAYPNAVLNATSASPTGTAVKPSAPVFTGAAPVAHANVFLAAFAASLGYMVL